MDKFCFLVLFVLVMAMPVSATDVTGGDVDDGDPAISAPAGATDSTDPADLSESEETQVQAQEVETSVDAYAVPGALAGGYYFVCDCALGSDLTFYVPNEWAHDVFTLDSSGAPVNLSTNTCYAYCPDYPDYTFSCSRFGTFTYRASNYNSADLLIAEISDTNISFFKDAAIPLSDTDFNVLGCGLLLILACFTIFKRGA